MIEFFFLLWFARILHFVVWSHWWTLLYKAYPEAVWYWVQIKVLKWTSELLGHGPNKVFLVPDSCGETEINGNSTSSDVTDDTIEYD